MELDPFYKFMIKSIQAGDYIFVSDGLYTLTIQVTVKLVDRIIGLNKSDNFVLYKPEYHRITGKMAEGWYK